MNSKDIVARIRPHWPHPSRLIGLGMLAMMVGFAFSAAVSFS